MGEFELIRRHFLPLGPAPLAAGGHGVALGIGDDCALLDLAAGQQLALSIDTAVAGVHFPHDADPEAVAQRSLRVALSDLAAAGAEPLGFTLALTLPRADDAWLTAFARGLAGASATYHCPLIGGDTTKGPLTISIQVHGSLPRGRMLTRSGAAPADQVLVSGTLGDARAALDVLQEPAPSPALLARYWYPEPRLALGTALRGLASAAIDISDGLLADLGHIAAASGVAIRLDAEALPLSPALTAAVTAATARGYALSGGDDYELAVCVPPAQLDEARRRAAALGCPLTRIGEVEAGSGLRCVDRTGQALDPGTTGYQHFGEPP